MNLRPILTSVLLTACFTGCATFNKTELGQIRQRGVAPAVVGKMSDGQVLTPSDVIELTRRGVPDSFILRQIDDAGVDYVLNRNDIKRLQAARVSRAVMDALIAGSDDFARHYGPSTRARVYAGDPYDDYYFGPYFSGPYYGGPYYGPYPSSYPYPYGGVSVEIGGGRGYWGHHHH